jgi:hypothetical protein
MRIKTEVPRSDKTKNKKPTSTMELEVSAKASNVSNVSSLMVKELKGNKMMVVPEEIPEPTGSSMKGPESGEGGLKNKMTAASALADLTSVSSPVDDEDDEDDDEGSIDSNLEEGKGELQLPVRFYKNGRKRAVPFVLKVRTRHRFLAIVPTHAVRY